MPKFQVACLVCGFVLAPAAFAQNSPISCVASPTTDLDFGTVDPLSSQRDAMAQLNYTCTNANNQPTGVTACFSILGGSQGGGQVAPRRMLNGAAPMFFDIYATAARTLPWGAVSMPSAGAPVLINIPNLAANSSTTGTLSLYGRVNANQTTLVPGSYQNVFSGGYTEIRTNRASPNDPNPPGTCGNGNLANSNFPFTARAMVTSGCRITTAGDMDFGTTASNYASNIDQVSTITLTCTSGLAWNVGLDNGMNASGTTRRMVGAGFEAYELYRDPARTARWGTTIGSDTQSGAGTGVSQNLPVYGRVPVQTPIPAGSYSDKITVTVTY